MPDFYITQNNQLPALIVQLFENGIPMNIAGASSVTFSMSKPDLQLVDTQPCTIVDAANGIVRYDWVVEPAEDETPGQNDTATIGVYIGQFTLTFNDLIQTVPDSDYLYITVSRPA